MTTYAITGITGHVGGKVAEYLIAAGATVRAVVRSEAKAKPWRDRAAQVALATLDDPAALRAAFDGVDGIFVMTPTWFQADDMFAENATAVMALGSALRAISPTKVVFLSSIGAHRSSGTGAIMKLHDMEVDFAGLPAATSVRAGWFMENYAGMISYVRESGILPSMLVPLDRGVSMIGTADIGRMVAETLQADWQGGRVIELEGPRRYSPHDVAAAFAVVLGRDVEAKVLPPSEWHSTYLSWGLTARSAEAMAEMLNGFNTGWITYENSEADTMHGATTLEAVLAELAR
jgi:NAD(P)H dehydrogenase (quinone)